METDIRKFEGVWWLPSDEDCSWDGVLTWEPKKSPKLKLKYRSVGEKEPPSKAEAFLGFDEGGTPLTVFRAGSAGGIRTGFLSKKDFTAGHVLRGVHVESLREFRANRVNVWLQNLGGWLKEEGFANSRSSWAAEYKRPPDRCFQISRDTVLKICHSSRAHAENRRRSVEYDIFFSIEKARAFDFFRAWKWLYALRLLLHFACIKRIYPTAVHFEQCANTFSVSGTDYPKELELLTAGIHSFPERELHPDDFVFTFEAVEDRFTRLAVGWLRFCAEQGEALRCYTTTVYFDLPSEVELICLTQALEAFHQRRFRPKANSEEARFVNRIRHLCRNHADKMLPLVGELGKFAESVKDSRHYYTHHDPDIRRKGNVALRTPLAMMNYHLQFLFRLCVLSQFGLDTDECSVLQRQIPNRVTEYF